MPKPYVFAHVDVNNFRINNKMLEQRNIVRWLHFQFITVSIFAKMYPPKNHEFLLQTHIAMPKFIEYSIFFF